MTRGIRRDVCDSRSRPKRFISEMHVCASSIIRIMGSLAVCELRALALVGGLALRLLLREKRCHRCEAGLELAGGARVPLAPRPPHPAR